MNVPSWALRKATLSDREVAKKAHNKLTARVVFKNRSGLRQWMKDKGWRRSWLFLEESFYKRLFDSDEDYTLALTEQVVEIFVPKVSHHITEERLKEIDHYYETRSWSIVVEALRDIRRAVQAGVIIEVEDKKLRSWDRFYTWAHGRYSMLEDGADKWIGDDG